MPRLTFIAVLVCALFSRSTSAAGDSPAALRLAAAIRIETVSYQDSRRIDYGEFQRFHTFLRSSFPRVFATLQVEAVNDHSLLLRWAGSDATAQPILFTAHMDVVPIEPGTEKDWQHPPFAGVIADSRVYGRGALDDKQGLLGLLEAAEQLLAEGFVPRRGIVFAFGHDEEISGRHGAAALARRMRELGLHFAWMVDEGGMLFTGNPLLPERPLAMINVAEKGYLTLTLEATGEGGHSSNPPKISTIGRLSAALARIEANPFEPRLVEPVRAMLQSLAPHLGLPERLLFSNLWLTGSMVARRMADDRQTQPLVRTTTALTLFNAGVKENVVPQRARASVNFRLLPGTTPADVVQRIEAIVDDPQIAISYDQWDNIPAVADSQGSGFAVIEAAVAEVYPEAVVVPSMLMATTDTRHYIDLADNQYRFHGVVVKAQQASSIHGTNEYIAVESYEKSIEVARRMLQLGAR
ncbi:MAG: M20/M25/M40 family metallo-hydrolase [Halioglobus sp.]|nr:M20/M25/M40 family metallo-hydrolase [Halioglobus sp.]